MSHVTIQFVRDQRWIVVWLVGVVVVCGLAAAIGEVARLLRHELASQGTKVADIRQQIAALQPRAQEAEKVAAPQASQLAVLLQGDINRAFAAAESQQEAGVRLRAMSYEAVAGELRLEFELDSIARAASVTANLNAGMDAQPWTMQQITASEAIAQSKSAPHAVARGTWVVELSKF